MSETFDYNNAAEVDVRFKNRQESPIDEEKKRRIAISVIMVVAILFVALGLINFQTGRAYNVPGSIAYKNAVYETEGEIITGEGLVKTHDKVGNLQVYLKRVAPGNPYSIPYHQVYVKAGDGYVVYFLKESE